MRPPESAPAGPVNSARPELLRSYERATAAAADELDRALRATEDAHRAYDAGCPARPVPIPVAIRGSIEGYRSLGTATGRVGESFSEADRDVTRDGVATAESAVLSEVLIRDHPGMVDALLAAPADQAAGARAAEELMADDPEDRLAALRDLVGDHVTPAWAAGFLNALGAAGLVVVLDDIAVARSRQAIETAEEADRMVRAIGDLLGEADTSLDPDLLVDLGRTGAGRDVLRQLTMAIGFVPTRRAVAIADQIVLTGDLDDLDRDPFQHSLFLERTELLGLGPGNAVAGLRLLAADPVAARIWEAAGPDEPSRLEQVMELPGPVERDFVAQIARAVLIDPVTMGQVAGQTVEFEGANRRATPLDRKIERFVEVFARSDSSPAIAEVLYAFRRAHPRIYDQALDLGGYAADLSAHTVDLFAPFAASPDVLARYTRDLTEAIEAQATRAVAETSPDGRDRRDGRDPNPDHITEVMGPVYREMRTLQLGAYQHGQTDDPILAALRWSTTTALAKGREVVTKAARVVSGPVGLVTGAAGSKAVECLEDEADERVFRHNDRADEQVSAPLQNAVAFGVARAMAHDPGWRRILVDPDDLEDRSPSTSAADAAEFATWVKRQPDRVREQLANALAADLPDDFVIEDGCAVDTLEPGG